MFKTPWVVVGILILLGLVGGAGFRLGITHERGIAAAQQELIERAADAFDAKVADHVSKIRPLHKTIQVNAKEIISEVPVYRDCVNDPSVERLLDAARANRSP